MFSQSAVYQNIIVCVVKDFSIKFYKSKRAGQLVSCRLVDNPTVWLSGGSLSHY